MINQNNNLSSISVVMPVHNAGADLATAVQSILCQSHANLELIIVDDHSSDDALMQLDSSDSRLSIIKSSGSGIVSALNTGIELADGEFIARMDADDIALPSRLQLQLEYLQSNPQIHICSTQVDIFRNQGQTGGGYINYQHWINQLTDAEEIARNIFVESPVPHPTVMLRKHHLVKLGGYQDNNWPEDYDLWLRAHLQGYKFGKPKGILLRWRDHDSRLSRTSLRYHKKAFIRAKAYYLTQLYPDTRFRIWGSGPTGARLHDEILSNSGTVVDFIDIAPRRIGNTKRNKPILDANQLEKSDDLILVAVSARGARDEIREFLNQRHFIEGADYICTA